MLFRSNAYLGLSGVNEKAVKRGQMSQEEIDKEIDESDIVDVNGEQPSQPVQAEPQPAETTTSVTTAPAENESESSSEITSSQSEDDPQTTTEPLLS